MSGRRDLLIVTICLMLPSLFSGCRKADEPSPTEVGQSSPETKNQAQDIEASQKASAPPPVSTATENTSADGTSAPSELSGLWGSTKKQKLGPSAPMAATLEGVLFITSDDRPLIARLGEEGQFTPVTENADNFNRFGRGPSLSPSHAYWTSEKGQLMGASLKSLKATVLHPQARSQTRTVALHHRGHDFVAFIKEVDNAALAYVWVGRPGQKGNVLKVSPEGSEATSVALVQGPEHPRVIVLAGRTGMSPLHVREIKGAGDTATLSEDEVIWVGPGSHPLTEIHAIDRQAGSAVVFLPTAKDFNDFGLAQLSIQAKGGEIPLPGWRIYPNGLDPAPVATSKICKNDYVLYARPTEARPYAPQHLHLARIEGDTPAEGEIIALARAFRDLSLVEIKGGAIAAWTAGGSTWAKVLSCPLPQ